MSGGDDIAMPDPARLVSRSVKLTMRVLGCSRPEAAVIVQCVALAMVDPDQEMAEYTRQWVVAVLREANKQAARPLTRAETRAIGRVSCQGGNLAPDDGKPNPKGSHHATSTQAARHGRSARHFRARKGGGGQP